MAYTHTVTSPKFQRLRAALNISTPLLLGHLELLWQYNHAHTKSLLGIPMTPDEVELAAEWEPSRWRPRGEFFRTLLEHGWLDERPDGYTIHDYAQHAPQFVKKRCEYQRAKRAAAPAQPAPVPPPKPASPKPKPAPISKPVPSPPPPPPPQEPVDDWDAEPEPAPDTDPVSAAAAEILKTLPKKTVDAESKAAHILCLTGEPQHYLAWWAIVVQRCAGSPDHYTALREAFDYAADCADPVKRKKKDLGELQNAGAYIASRLKQAGVQLPPRPRAT